MTVKVHAGKWVSCTPPISPARLMRIIEDAKKHASKVYLRDAIKFPSTKYMDTHWLTDKS